MTTESFIQKAKAIHGDKYDYSLVEYVNTTTPVKIQCYVHGIFEQTKKSHIDKKSDCPRCAGNVALTTETFIQKAKAIHGDKYDYSKVKYVGCKNKVVVKCVKHNNEFEQSPYSHLFGSGCPICGRDKTNSAQKQTLIEFVQKSKDIHGDKFDYSSVEYVNANTKVKIKCRQCNYEFEQTPGSHIAGNGCQKCAGNTILTTEEFIQKAKGIHGNKYDYSLVECKNSGTKVKIICPKHGEFEQVPSNHLMGNGCGKCAGNIKLTNGEFIKKAKQIHGDNYDYSLVKYVNTDTNIKIICPVHGEFEQRPSVHLKSQGCPRCSGFYKLSREEFLNKAKKVHGDKYDYSLAEYVNTDTKVKIICPIHGMFEQIPANHLQGQGCSICNHGWRKSHKLSLLNSLESSDLLTMDPIELSIIIGQGNLPIDFRPLINTEADTDERIATLQELRERLEDESNETSPDANSIISVEDVDEVINNEDEDFIEVDDVDEEITSVSAIDETKLPQINPIADLHSLDNSLYATMDEEAIESLVQYKLRKLWNQVLNDIGYVETLRDEIGGTYFTTIKNLFFEEYNKVVNYTVPAGYSFEHEPNLMQKLTVQRLLKNKSYGNWSGTGAGKTLSFIIASREIDAALTLVVALNSTIKQTCKAIKNVYPDSLVFTEYKDNYIFDRSRHNYLILNYEKFQQGYSEEMCQSLTNNNQVDFVVIDEVHNSKQRDDNNETLRRIVLNRLLGRIRETNASFYTLVMSATPVINNLFEAKSLLNLMTGLEYEDLETRKSLANALNIFRQLILNGLRFIPKYDIGVNELTGQNMTNLSATANYLLDDLLALRPSEYVDVEKMLLDEKFRMIANYIRKGVIIYTYFTTGIVERIEEFVQSLGFTTATYTGDESPYFRDQNLADFVDGNIDVLIGSKPIGTGVDGLQEICDRMILITLPWTDSEYTQLKGRIFRQGSIFDNVEFIIPQVKVELGEGEIWSWDIQRLNLIKNKKTLADAAVDGIIPSRIMPTAGTMFKKSQKSLQLWKDRINQGQIIGEERSATQINLYPEIIEGEERRHRINSELSEFNRRGKTLHSTTMHNEFADNPDSWFHYHALRNESMKEWNEIPYEYIATKIKNRRSIVADFGCGENKMRHCIPNNQVFAFDHIACDDSVIACDIKDVSAHLESESVDVAVFSLALWGTNYKEYITEAYRVLAFGGVIHIAETAKKYEEEGSEEELANLITEAGFKIVGKIERRDKFIYITGMKM